MSSLSSNLRRCMARRCLSLDQVAERSGLDRRTVRGLLKEGSARPHARTLNRLADGLAVDVDELFTPSATLAHRSFDRRTNPAVTGLIQSEPHRFAGWTEEDFDELYSRFGAGGALTTTGAVAAVERMNRNRRVQSQVAVILESDQSDLLTDLVSTIYRRIVVSEPSPSGTGMDAGPNDARLGNKPRDD